MSISNIADWQRRYRLLPQVWQVWIGDEASGIYESKEAAELEIIWLGVRGHKNARAVPHHVCSLELSHERWSPTTQSQSTEDEVKR